MHPNVHPRALRPTLGSEYDADYFERGVETGKSLYHDYRWLPHETIPLALEIIDALGLKVTDRVLDYGCAKGYLVRALHELGYTNARGIDISEYAADIAADAKVRWALRVGGYQTLTDGEFDAIIAKDVLEHIEEREIPGALSAFRAAAREKLLIVVPLGSRFGWEIPDMALDPTHKVCRPLGWWSGKVEDAGFKIERCGWELGPRMKKRWRYSGYPLGHGVIIAT